MGKRNSALRRTTFGRALLKSSLPLEYAVSTALEGLKLMAKGPYTYVRDGEVFSTDQWTIEGYVVEKFTFRNYLFIESKYRDPSVAWCFFPPSENVLDNTETSIVDAFAKAGTKRSFSLIGMIHPLPPGVLPAGSGIEMLKNQEGGWDSNPKTLANAVRQVILPYGDIVTRVVRRNLVLDTYGPEIALYHPIIVTTARLMALKQGMRWSGGN